MAKWKLERWSLDLYPGATKTFERYRDLGARELVIVGCATLDAALAELISLRLRDDWAEIVDFLGADVDGRAPAGTFGARIQLAYLLAIIEESEVKALRALKNLRNLMSHRVDVDLLQPQAQKHLDVLRGLLKRFSSPSSDIASFLQRTVVASRTDPKAAAYILCLQFELLNQDCSHARAAVSRVDSLLTQRVAASRKGLSQEAPGPTKRR